MGCPDRYRVTPGRSDGDGQFTTEEATSRAARTELLARVDAAVEAIANAQVPIVAAASHQSRDPASPHHFLYQAAAWPARQVDAELVEVPGGHMAYPTQPAAVAESLRPLLADLS
jgi:hypothetical protein